MASVVSKTLSLCVLFTLCFCFCLASNDILLYSKVHLVDTVTVDNGVTNFLFRGNMPKDANNNFAYDELLGMMAKRVQEANSTLSFPKASDVNLFVVSFNSLYNKPDTDIEVKYFAQNPDKGSFVNWSFYHRYKDPNTLTQQQIQDAVANSNLWGPDQIPNRVTTAYEMMHNATTDGRSLVIYVHCETGCDRTGEFCAAYYMQYQQQSFQTSEQYNTVDCGRPPNPGAVNAIEWYCYYLQYEVGIPTTSLGACKRSSAASVLKPRAPSTPQLIYTAVFLTQESKDLILSNFAPTHPQVYAEHMTISFRPSKEVLANLPWGQNVTLTVIGVGNDDKAQAAVINSNGVFSSDPITHVTVSTEAGVGPVYSNDLLKKGWDKIDTPFTITGRIGAYFSDHSIVYESPRN